VTSTNKLQLDLTTTALGVVALTIVGAIGVGFAAGVASAFLVFVTGALLGAILLVWHSLRTLAGDAEVDLAFEHVGSTAPTELSDKKRRALRALKDLEQEHSLGKIDDRDYAALAAQYRDEAKDVIREMDDSLAPYREKAEELVRAHLEKHKLLKEEAHDDEDDVDAEPVAEQRTCASCKTKNDADATFCKKCGAKIEAT
jgi:hypothetical protein